VPPETKQNLIPIREHIFLQEKKTIEQPNPKTTLIEDALRPFAAVDVGAKQTKCPHGLTVKPNCTAVSKSVHVFDTKLTSSPL
jgi:hypothetical protein